MDLDEPASASEHQASQEKVTVENTSNHHGSIVGKVLWMPPWCRWDKTNPPQLTVWLNILYSFAAGFTSANNNYPLPILDVLAREFHTNQAGVSTLPTLAQAGAATGILFVLPLADFFPRRHFTLTLAAVCSCFWIGLCFTSNLTVFLVLTYLSAVFTGAPQIMLPLVAELSAPEKRAFNISIVGAGPSLGILLARILSGVVTQYTGWRNVYWMALGLQGLVFTLLWLFMPDYPATNPSTVREIAKKYPKILWSIVELFPKSPILVQSSLSSFCTFFTVSSYWTTLTFLLAGKPYQYNSSVIGLFGLVGISTMILGPLYSKYIINPLKQPAFSVIVGQTINLIGIVIGTYAGLHTVAAPILQAFLLDAGLIVVSIATRMAIHEVSPLGRNRVNTAFVSILYLGQLSGTKAGNIVYEKYGGWVAAGSLSVGIIVFGYIVVAVRGPHETRWIGWSGGWGMEPKAKPGDVEVAAEGNGGAEKEEGSEGRGQKKSSTFEEEDGGGLQRVLSATVADIRDVEGDQARRSRSVPRKQSHG